MPRAASVASATSATVAVLVNDAKPRLVSRLDRQGRRLPDRCRDQGRRSGARQSRAAMRQSSAVCARQTQARQERVGACRSKRDAACWHSRANRTRYAGAAGEIADGVIRHGGAKSATVERPRAASLRRSSPPLRSWQTDSARSSGGIATASGAEIAGEHQQCAVAHPPASQDGGRADGWASRARALQAAERSRCGAARAAADKAASGVAAHFSWRAGLNARTSRAHSDREFSQKLSGSENCGKLENSRRLPSRTACASPAL